MPAAWSLLQSFTNFTLLGPEARHLHVNGLENYGRALQDPGFWNSLRASVLYVAGSAIVGQVGCGLVLALLTFKHGGPLGGLVRGVAVTAWIIPTIVVAILWNVFLHAQGGTLNRMLGTHIDWLAVDPCSPSCCSIHGRVGIFHAPLRCRAAHHSGLVLRSRIGFGRVGVASILGHHVAAFAPATADGSAAHHAVDVQRLQPVSADRRRPRTQTEVLPIFTWRIAFRDFELGYGAALSDLALAGQPRARRLPTCAS